MNCLLIEMGEMACYQERCQECGRIPPGRKALPGKKGKPPDVLKTLVGRQLADKKYVTTNGDLEDYTRTNHSDEQQGSKQSDKHRLKDGPGTVYSKRQLQGDSMV